jgi:hypothetical protein
LNIRGPCSVDHLERASASCLSWPCGPCPAAGMQRDSASKTRTRTPGTRSRFCFKTNLVPGFDPCDLSRNRATHGDLDTINPNFKGFQIINHLRNYFKQITPFCFASQGGEAEAGASPGGVAKRGSASPLRVAKQKSVCRHCDWRRRRACFATVSGDAL